MKRTTFLLIMLLTGHKQLVQAQTNTGRPNILWITCEDMSANLPAYGDSTITTPTIDRLAKEGVRFTRMFSVAGVCAPSRSAIISGMYPNSIGTQHMRTGSGYTKRQDIPNYEAVPPAEVKCFPEYLRANGYYCTNNEKTDYQFGNPSTAWDENSKQAHWRNRPQGMPFFSVFNSMRTHESQVWVHKDKPLRVDPAKVKVPLYYPDTEVIRRDIARYYDNIMVMDSLAGSILKQLEEDSLLENTIVFFFSDHGAGLPWYKRELYDRGLHVPLIVRFPGKKGAGIIENELHSFVDFAPTLLSLTGTPLPRHLQGQAFLGENTAKTPRTYIYGARDRMDEHYDMVRVVRDKRYKYVRNFQPDKPYYQDLAYRKQMDLMQEILRLREAGQLPEITKRWFGPKPLEELYDLSTDPFELTNLAGDKNLEPVRQKLRNVLNDWMIEVNDKGFSPEMEMVSRMWPSGQQPVTQTPTATARKDKSGRTVSLACVTEGASITYQLGDDNRWQLYYQPIYLPKGKTLKYKSVRYGYQESPVTQWREEGK